MDSEFGSRSGGAESESFDAQMRVVDPGRWKGGAGKIPLFGQTNEWDLTGLGRPANRYKTWGFVSFSGLSPHFNLLARELALCQLHPMHAAVRARGVFLPNKPAAPPTVARSIQFIRFLQQHQVSAGLPEQLGYWSVDDLRSAVTSFSQNGRKPAPVADFALWLTSVQKVRAVFTSGFPEDPIWSFAERKQWARLSDKANSGSVKETPMTPDLFYPLVAAAVAYVDNFSEDILAAQRNLASLRASEGKPSKRTVTFSDEEINRLLQDSHLLVPLHSGGRFTRGTPNYRLLSQIISNGRTSSLFSSAHEKTQVRRRALVDPFIDAGKTQIGAFHIRASGFRERSRDLWHEPFDAENLLPETFALRTACYIVVAITTLMRDNEIQAITKGSLATYYGAPAIKSELRKNRPEPEDSYWWLHPIGAKAIKTAEQLSSHDTHIFAALRDMSKAANPHSDGTGFAALDSIDKFIAHVNRNVAATGLAKIPTDEKAIPRKFRRTMAVQVGQQPGGEIALGIILKHIHARALANASTIGYATPSAPWMLEYETSRIEASLEAIITSWDDRPAEHRAVSGPGASTYNDAMDSVAAQATRPQVGDLSQKVALLKGAFPGFRVGTLNHCMGDLSKARCATRTADQGTIDAFYCEPSKCGNSVITSEHIPLLRSELNEVESMLKGRNLGAASRAMLEERKATIISLVPRDEQL